MIRLEETNDWVLLAHADHAALAGEFARHWKNRNFAPPPPFAHVLDAVSRHDDSWASRDREPELTPAGNPSAFSHELVGSYDAFEEIDLADYLRVRGEATEQAARRDPYAAILISMHTVNLLTEQADLSTLDIPSRRLHTAFIEGQRTRQRELADQLDAYPDLVPFRSPEAFRRGFEFLQACDSFSLLVGVDFPEVSSLRHQHPTRDGRSVTISFRPLGDNRYALDPYPLNEPEISFQIPCRRVPREATRSLATFRRAYREAELFFRVITVSGQA